MGKDVSRRVACALMRLYRTSEAINQLSSDGINDAADAAANQMRFQLIHTKNRRYQLALRNLCRLLEDNAFEEEKGNVFTKTGH